MKPEVTDDKTRWEEAESLLAKAPTESADRRSRRWRRLRLLLVLAIAVLGLVLGFVLFVVLGVPTQTEEGVPTWQVVTGLSIVGAGLVIQFFGLFFLVRTHRALGGLRGPLSVLTRTQRKALLAQVRGQQPAEPARLPIARVLARQLSAQRMLMVAFVGMGIAAVGHWLASPATWRLVLGGVFALLLGVGLPLVERDVRRARRFLERHPDTAD